MPGLDGLGFLALADDCCANWATLRQWLHCFLI